MRTFEHLRQVVVGGPINNMCGVFVANVVLHSKSLCGVPKSFNELPCTCSISIALHSKSAKLAKLHPSTSFKIFITYFMRCCLKQGGIRFKACPNSISLIAVGGLSPDTESCIVALLVSSVLLLLLQPSSETRCNELVYCSSSMACSSFLFLPLLRLADIF